jgi:3-methyladenine DNA glycosylase/8-oxoguanine DNA glycosylase
MEEGDHPQHQSSASSRKVEASADRQAFETRLCAFEGIGPKTVEIFMREAGKVIF